MRRVLDISGLSINRNTYYNLVRGKSLEQLNNSFERLILALEEVGFKFNYLIGNNLTEDGNYKRKILE